MLAMTSVDREEVTLSMVRAINEGRVAMRTQGAPF